MPSSTILDQIFNMLGIDTNILLYAVLEECPHHDAACTYLEGLQNNTRVAIAELVLVELYLALRNPTLFSSPLGAKEAVEVCRIFRDHPCWQLVENAKVMDEVWEEASQHNFARRRIFDLRLAKTLQAHGVTEFATANTKDFQDIGFHKVWNPLLH
ncbi:MAG: PIN domain-containing protein [Chthoniobacterales bacterium]|nr:PIN domain-containing protein [Chthoniobacterales bacterium]